MASITSRQNASGITTYQVKIRKNGFPAQSKTFPTRKLAEDWAKVTEAAMIRGTFVPQSETDITPFSAILQRYLDTETPRKKGAKRETQRLRLWLRHPLAKQMLSKVRSADIAQFRDEWRAAGKAENTIRLEVVLLSKVFKTARTEFGFPDLQNPCSADAVRLPGGSRERNRRFVGDEETRLFAELAKSRNKLV